VRFDGQGAMRVLADVAEAVQSLAEPGFVWFDVGGPRPEELTPLGAALNLHPLSLEDCLDENQIPKLDIFPNYSFLLFNHHVPPERHHDRLHAPDPACGHRRDVGVDDDDGC